METKILYFVHGTTYDNLEHKATGWLPGELSPKGIEQAKALKEKVDIEKIDIVFCSDLKRAIDSAEIVFGGEKTIIKDNRLRECNYGDYNGKDSKLADYSTHITERFPNGESLLDVEKRMRSMTEGIDNHSKTIMNVTFSSVFLERCKEPP